MAGPKKKMSPSRRNMRRANHDKRTAPNLGPCANCQEMVPPHRLCPSCGHYKGRQVVQTAEE